MGTSAEEDLYKRLGLDFEVLDSGCCGLAGSFGFERGHHDISVQIGEQRLMPAVREAGETTLVISDGFSCKTQIAELTERRGLHTAQVIKMAMEAGREGPAGARPEEGYPDVVVDGNRSRAAVVGLAALGIAAAALAAVGLIVRR